MKNLTPPQKLDEVLEDLRSVQSNERVTFEMIHGDYKSKVNEHQTAEEMQRILYKLKNDGYLWDKGTYLSITFDGLLFHGYEKQQEVDRENEAITARNESRRLRNDHRLIVGTWFAGIAALLLFGWQVFLYFYPVHTDCPYFFWHK